MAKSRRKSGGCTRGRLKQKKMGKGWSTMRRQRGSVKPIRREEQPASDESTRREKQEQSASSET